METDTHAVGNDRILNMILERISDLNQSVERLSDKIDTIKDTTGERCIAQLQRIQQNESDIETLKKEFEEKTQEMNRQWNRRMAILSIAVATSIPILVVVIELLMKKG